MEQHVDNLASAQGRRLLQRYWYENLVEGRRWKLVLLATTWRICLFGRTIYLSEGPVTVDHALGLRLGTRVWMEEISYRHFANSVQALVYLGAVVLLIFVGLRFANLINERIALIGIGIEATMLFLLFVVMFFTPDDTIAEMEVAKGSGDSPQDYLPLFREIYDELQDIGTMNAALGRHLTEIANKQEAYLREVSQKLTSQPTAGLSTETVALLHDVKTAFSTLAITIQEMNKNITRISEKELEYLVRREMEKLVDRGLRDGGKG
jgi:hypothetical protein